MTMQQQDKFNHIQRMWSQIMDGEPISQKSWNSESESEQNKFYQWICNQFGELVDLV